jgi:hypothetical protein
MKTPMAHSLARLAAFDFLSRTSCKQTEPNEAQPRLVNDGMKILVGALGRIVSGIGQVKH